MKKQKVIKAVSYIRTATCSEDLSAVHYQKQLIKEYLKKHPEIIIVGSYRDLGISGNTSLHERQDGLRLLKDARGKKFDMVLVATINRFARNSKMLIDSVNSLVDLRIKVRSATEPFINKDLEGKIQFNTVSSSVAFGLGLDGSCIKAIH